jgi:hypothetical protein
MIEKILGLEKMSILQCQEAAKKFGFDSVTFDLCGPKGKVKAKWLDAYMGMFKIEGQDGFIISQQIQFSPDTWCENLMPTDSAIAAPKKGE